jgi:hypothetical protein
VHALLGGGQAQAGELQAAPVEGRSVGHRLWPGRHVLQPGDDLGAVHHHLAVVEHQGRRLYQGVDGVKSVEVAKHRQGLVLEGNASIRALMKARRTKGNPACR